MNLIKRIKCQFKGHTFEHAGSCPFTGATYMYCNTCNIMAPMEVVK